MAGRNKANAGLEHFNNILGIMWLAESFMIVMYIPDTFRQLYKKLLGQTKGGDQPIFMADNSRYSTYQVGEWTYGTPTVLSWNEGSTLVVGKFCSFALGVTILLGGEHRTDWV